LLLIFSPIIFTLHHRSALEKKREQRNNHKKVDRPKKDQK